MEDHFYALLLVLQNIAPSIAPNAKQNSKYEEAGENSKNISIACSVLW